MVKCGYKIELRRCGIFVIGLAIVTGLLSFVSPTFGETLADPMISASADVVDEREESSATADPLAQDSRLAQLVTIRAKAGKEDELARRLLALVDLTRTEPGCLRYDAYEKTRGVWLVFEYWQDEAALQVHMSKSYSKAFLNDMEGFVVGNPEVNVLRRVDVGL